MNLDKYTQKSQEAILTVQNLSQDYQHQVVEPIHLHQPGGARHLVEVAYNADYGVRPLKRAIQRELQDPLAIRS